MGNIAQDKNLTKIILPIKNQNLQLIIAFMNYFLIHVFHFTLTGKLDTLRQSIFL
jgi:hypothetical protein